MGYWLTLENTVDIQIIPEDEDELHEFNVRCRCSPNITKRTPDEKIIYSHYSLCENKVFEKAEDVAQMFYPLQKNSKDC